MYQGSKDNMAQVGGNACTCSTFSDKYTWKSDQLPTFDPYETCRILGNRTVLIIGDSTMQQTTATLMNALFPVGCQTQIVAGGSDIDNNFSLRLLLRNFLIGTKVLTFRVIDCSPWCTPASAIVDYLTYRRKYSLFSF